MESLNTAYLREELLARQNQLRAAAAQVDENAQLVRLLNEVDGALDRIRGGSYGLCEECHDPIEPELVMADPLVRMCSAHLSEAEQQALAKDLELAAQVQNRLLPESDLRYEPWEVAFHYQPLGKVSGDYCDLVATPPGDLLLVLGDVSGKGIPASMLMAHLNATVRSLVSTQQPANELVAQVNRFFCESTLPAHYATLVCGRARVSGEIELCNAGHCPPLHLHQGKVTRIKSTGLPVGLFCAVDYTLTTVRMEPGDSLLLYTDGITEARNREDAEYGEQRLHDLLVGRIFSPAQELIRICLEDVDQFREQVPRDDDLTIMVLQRPPGAISG